MDTPSTTAIHHHPADSKLKKEFFSLPMSSFSTRDLYGGAITAQLPTDFLDASDLRQVPDHQEVYLSPRTLTSAVLEINQYISSPCPTVSQTGVDPFLIAPAPPKAGGSANGAEAGANLNLNNDNAAAALYHLRDLVDPKDTLTLISTPKSVQMQRPSLAGLPAFIVRGRVSTRETKGRVPSVLPEEYQHAPDVEVQTSTTIRLLLVRIEAKGTDLCVAVNVPWKELEEGKGVEEEEGFADAVLENVVKSLDVRDFGLFGE
jgi:Ran-interacting Mog1 protein